MPEAGDVLAAGIRWTAWPSKMVESDHEQRVLKDEEEDQDSLLRRRMTYGSQLGLGRAAEECDWSAKLDRSGRKRVEAAVSNSIGPLEFVMYIIKH